MIVNTPWPGKINIRIPHRIKINPIEFFIMTIGNHINGFFIFINETLFFCQQNNYVEL